MGTYLNELRPEDLAWKEIPLSEVIPSPAGGIDTGKKPPEPPVGIGHYKKFGWAKEIKAVAIIPDFQVLTADARGVLPQSYTRADVVSIRSLVSRNSKPADRNAADLQSPAHRVTTNRTGPVTTGCRHDLPGHAGQSPPALPQGPNPRLAGDLAVRESKYPARTPWNLPIRCGTNHFGTRHHQLRADRGNNYCAF